MTRHSILVLLVSLPWSEGGRFLNRLNFDWHTHSYFAAWALELWGHALFLAGIGDGHQLHSVFWFRCSFLQGYLSTFSEVYCLYCLHDYCLCLRRQCSRKVIAKFLQSCAWDLLWNFTAARPSIAFYAWFLGVTYGNCTKMSKRTVPKYCKRKVWPWNNHILTRKDTFGSSLYLAHPHGTSSKFQSQSQK